MMAFDIDVEGHHPGYIQNLVKYWCATDLPGCLNIVVTPLFIKKHVEVVKTVSNCPESRIQLVPIEPEEYRDLGAPQMLRYFKGWNLFCRYAEKLQATYGLIMYFDFFQLPSRLGRRTPCPFPAFTFDPLFTTNILPAMFLPYLSG